MIKSMTGFGRGEHEEFGRSYIVEIKSVNHRYSDISVKLPKQLSYLEDTIRKFVSEHISRGKIDVYITQDKYSEDEIRVTVDHALASSYIKALHELRDTYKLEDDVSVSNVSKFPDLLTVDRVEDDKDKVWNTLSAAIEESLENLTKMREMEGRKLFEDLSNRAKYIKSVVDEINKRSPVVVQEYKTKLEERIKQLLGDIPVDETRLAQEVAIFADKSSITEEVVRLYSHLDQLLSILNEDVPVGRKLDFLVQEMNREINTIGSKASDIIITRYVVEVKSEIEKIREQIQNIE